jgi:MFS superfamily sulfate permease-like transporter
MRNGDFRFDLREASGALGDLGTLLPLALGALAVGGLASTPILAGFGLAYCATALIYRLPVPVQPMKAIVAVLLVTEVTPATLAASGVMVGLVLVVLGATGWIDRVGRLVPQSVLAGLQLGLGAALALLAADLMRDAPVLALSAGALLLALLYLTRLPAALIILVLAGLYGVSTGVDEAPIGTGGGAAGPLDLQQALGELALPQLALTLTNAVVLTSLVAGDCFGARGGHVTPRRLSLSSGLLNLVLSPLGALPMCHGAGGLAAHHRLGARSGGAPLMLGIALLIVACLPGQIGVMILAAIPAAALGALLLFAAWQLAWSRRLVDCKPSCRPVIAATAAATVLWDPFCALAVGTASEALRVVVLRRAHKSS